MRRKPRKRRHGFTLIELLVAITLFAVILPMAGWTVYVLLRAQTASADSLADAMTLSRFARAFREDVHAAQSAEVDVGGSSEARSAVFHLESPRTVSYAAKEDGLIVRTVQNESRIECREQFLLSGTQTRFERSLNAGTLAAVHKPRSFSVSASRGVTATGSTIRVEAVVGRDRRFEHSVSGASKEPPPPALPTRPKTKGKRS